MYQKTLIVTALTCAAALLGLMTLRMVLQHIREKSMPQPQKMFEVRRHDVVLALNVILVLCLTTVLLK